MSGLATHSGSLAVLAVLTLLPTTAWAEDSKKGPGTQHIVGGHPVEPDEFPFVVFIDGGDWFCTGSIIAPDWILTAAHCVVEGDGSVIHPSGITVEHGYPHDRQEREVIRVIAHPEYEYGGAGFVNDVALVRIAEPFDNKLVVPVAVLNTEEEGLYASSGTLATAVGWGRKENDEWSEELRKVVIPLTTPEDCRRNYSFADEEEIAHERTLCAGAAGKRTNSGDSGGPLLVPLGGRWGQVGITSMTGRTESGDPVISIFTRVSSIHDWIEDQIADKLYFAHFGVGDGLTSDLVLVNPSNRRGVTGQVRFFDPDGKDLSPSLIFSSDQSGFTIEPRGSRVISPESGGGLQVGSVLVTSQGRLTGFIRFRIAGTGMTGVSAGTPSSRAVVPVQLGEIRTGLAIRNVGKKEARVRLLLVNGAGDTVQVSDPIDIPGEGQVARFIDEYLSVSDLELQGSVVVEAIEGKIVVIALELGSKVGEFATLPVSD